MLAALLATIVAAPAEAARSQFDLEGHRGTRGLRPENTLAAFGKALQIGVTTLELDTGITKDGYVVVSHERRISSLECRDTGPVTAGDPAYPYVGKLIHELTLAQIKTLDCGTRHPADPAKDPFIGTQEPVPGARMPLLSEVFQLADRYGAHDVQFNIETKLDPTLPAETVDPTTFAGKVASVIRRHKKTSRSMLQSFDWRTLLAAKRVLPGLRTVALIEPKTAEAGKAGRSPWLAGRDIDRFGGDVAAAAASVGASVLSPTYGTGTWGKPDFRWYLTKQMIRSAHRHRLKVVPWTVNEIGALRAVLAMDVDGLITDYPNRARRVMAHRHMKLPRRYASPFDVEGHRGARAVRPENTLPAFDYALSIGVNTLELDTGVTKDGVLVVSHNRNVNTTHCKDTAPVTPGDPQFPYSGKLIHDLTLAQIKTLDCGHTDPGFPRQVAQPGAKMPTLQEVFDLVKRRGNTTVRFNIETKISPLVVDTVAPDVFAQKLVRAIEQNHLEDRAMIQSFDWRTLETAKLLNRRIETVALVWQFSGEDCNELSDECSLEAVVGNPSVRSPWTGSVNWWDYRDLAKLVLAIDADVVSSNWQVHDPNQGTVVTDNFDIKEDPRNYHGPTVREIQRQGLRVVPYTIDDERLMQRVIDLGVDGIISDDPALLIQVAKRNGLR